MQEGETKNGENIGREKLNGYTANIAFAGFATPKLLWMLPQDYINYRFTGVHCTDYTDASCNKW